jgi:hypothetical protein
MIFMARIDTKGSLSLQFGQVLLHHHSQFTTSHDSTGIPP